VKKVTDHMRDKCAKTEIKLKHNFMNIIAYRVRYNEPVAPPGARRSGVKIKPKVDRSLPWVRGHMVLPDPTPWL
jgi:hypothetical protein